MILCNISILLSFAALGLGLEFTSFDQCGQDADKDCTFVRNGYAAFDPSDYSGPMLVFPDKEYTFTWSGADPDYPVRISWHFFVSSKHEDGNEFDPPSPDTMRWAYNVTDGETFTWKPRGSLEDFPTRFANMTGEEALGQASLYKWNYIGISQPDAPEFSNDDATGPDWQQFSWSDPFTLQPQIVEQFLTAQNEKGHREEYNSWRLGVGIGVGIGVPVLMAAAAFLAYRLRRTVENMPLNKKYEHRMSG